MRHETIGLGGLRIMRGRYGNSRLEVRGPLRRLDRGYIACAGGTETFGPDLAQPFPALLEQELSRPCVNLGTLNAEPGALFGDAALLALCNGADRVVLQLAGAQGLDNRFYPVHPRRNDRFLRASAKLRALYPEIDFTDFSFVRHMLETLHRQDPRAVRRGARRAARCLEHADAWPVQSHQSAGGAAAAAAAWAARRRPALRDPGDDQGAAPAGAGPRGGAVQREGTEAAQHRRAALDLAGSLTAEAC